MDDDFVVVLIGAALVACAVMLYIMVAGAAAALLAALAAIEAVVLFVSRLISIVIVGIRTRGGDQRVVCPPEPAYEIYFSRPLIRDFRSGFRVSSQEVLANAASRYTNAMAKFTKAARPLAYGVGLGAYLGAGLGVVVGLLVAVPLGFVVLVVASFVWAGSRLLQRGERLRRRLRGAHFDCPSCHERSVLPVYVCPGCGAKHRQLLPGRWGVRRRRCECDAISLPVLEAGGRHTLTAECPVCSHLMPGAGGIVPEIAVPIVGGPKAGKTAYLASLLVELDDRTQAGSSRLSVVEDSRQDFKRLSDDLRTGRVPAKTLDRDVTPAFVAEVRSGSSRSALLYAHDVAGERFQQADAVRDMSSLTRARGALLLIDPFSLRAVASTLDGQEAERALIDPSAESPQSVAERFLQALRESGRGDIKKLPVAVVLSKADALKAVDGSLSPGDEGESVSEWLETHGGGNLVRMIEAEFENHRFFAASALGRLPAPEDTSAFAPVGTLQPFFWLLAQNKISMTETAAETGQTVTEQLAAKVGARPVAPWPRTPVLAPGRPSPGGYLAGLLAALLAVGGATGLVVAVSKRSPSSALAAAPSAYTAVTTANAYTSPVGTGTGTTATIPAPVHHRPRPHLAPPAAALRQYWSDAARGNFLGAESKATPSEQGASPVATFQSELPVYHILSIGSPRNVVPGEVIVRVNFFAHNTIGSDQVCRHFIIDARMRHDSHGWRYDGPSDVPVHAATPGNPNCPQ